MSKKQAATTAKPAEPPKKAGFDAKSYAKNGVT